MENQFSAGPQALGYFYQARVALDMLLDSRDEATIKIEALDDIQVDTSTSPTTLTLAQLKHNIKGEPTLTDSSTDLWKSIRVWAEQVSDKSFALSNTKLILITTAKSNINSIASMLGVSDRDHEEALKRLIEISTASKNESLKKSFTAFKALSEIQKKALITSITILTSHENIDLYKETVKRKIRPAVKKIHLESLYERVEGWWFNQVVVHLLEPEKKSFISAFDLNEKVASLATNFAEDDLPIDFQDETPDKSYFVDSNNKTFVKQLRAVNSKERSIEKAIIDYYRAFNQRSRWINDGLVLPEELTKFEHRLIDEWERYFDSIYDECNTGITEGELIEIGKEIINWAEFKTTHLKIRPKVGADFIRRGSFHMLAEKPAICWHPEFKEKLISTINIAAT